MIGWDERYGDDGDKIHVGRHICDVSRCAAGPTLCYHGATPSLPPNFFFSLFFSQQGTYVFINYNINEVVVYQYIYILITSVFSKTPHYLHSIKENKKLQK